ncbi:MAG: carbohydrate ABC transporter permease, partial [Acetanaerobacterium sp.]
MEKMLSNKKNVILFMFPAMLLFCVFFLIPIIFSTILGFTQWDGTSIHKIQFIGIANFVKLFTEDPVFWVGIKNTLIILLVQLGIQIPLTVVLTLALDRCTRGAKFYKSVYFIPVIFSASAVGLLWSRLYDVNFGLFNRIFETIGVGYQQQWLSSDKTVIFALLIPMIWRSVGYYLIILY